MANKFLAEASDLLTWKLSKPALCPIQSRIGWALVLFLWGRAAGT